jgi:coenzyme F420-reducing hydrogenase beta subunit
MIVIKQKQDCCGCCACAQACPKQAIFMKSDEEGFSYPSIDLAKCIDCGICEKVCPEIQSSPVSNITNIFACYRLDFEKRLKSQSGGIFALLAETILKQGGIVYGAAFDDDWNLRHICVKDEKELLALQRSKYMQSDIDKIFFSVQHELSSGKRVLFSGTPCQIQGLKKFLRKDYDKLITIDLICHGVASPKVWNQYLVEYLKGNRLVDFTVKDKIKKNAVVIRTDNGKENVEPYEQNAFTRGFCNNLFLRPSCHKCSFKGVERCSDITLGDFWGIERFYPEFADKYGISAALIHTEIGKNLFSSVEKSIKSIECTTEMLLNENPCVICSSKKNDNRDLFFKLWNQAGVIKSVKKILKPTLKEQIDNNFDKITESIRCFVYIIKRRMLK